MRMRQLPAVIGAFAVLAAIVAFAAGANGVTIYTNPNPISIPDGTLPPGSSATSSTITVPSFPQVGQVDVGLKQVAHDGPDDIDIVLVSPSGQKVILMSDAGSTANAIAGVDLFFQDVHGPLPDESQITSGFYRPSNYGPTPDAFCAHEMAEMPPDPFPGGPAPPFQPTLSAFIGQPGTGTWTLWVADDCNGFTGSIGGGWELALYGPSTVAVRKLSATLKASTVTVRWSTASEVGTLGFNLFRTVSGRIAKANRALIRAKAAGASRGSSYHFVDTRVPHAVSYTYRLQIVREDGTRAWAGSVSLRPA